MIGATILQPALGSVIEIGFHVPHAAAGDFAAGSLFAIGVGQASYGISQGDYTGVIGLGLSIGLSRMLLAEGAAQGDNGAGGGTGSDNILRGSGGDLVIDQEPPFLITMAEWYSWEEIKHRRIRAVWEASSRCSGTRSKTSLWNLKSKDGNRG